MTGFDDVISPITREKFLSDIWNKSFLHLRGEAGRFTSLLTWDELNCILEQHRLSPPRLKLIQNGKPVEASSYIVPGIGGVPRLDSGKTITRLAQGATLVLDCVEELAPRVRDLAVSFQEVLHAGNYVNLYAGWGHQNGFDLHWDCQDTMILQLSGRKRWKIFQPTRLHPLQNDIEVPLKPTGEPAWDGLLEDGDMLYLPRGWWHIAYPVSEPSLHLTVAAVPPYGLDFLQWLMNRLRQYPEIRMNMPHPANAEALKTHASTLRTLLTNAWSDTAMDEFWKEWAADIRARPRFRLPFALHDQSNSLAAETRLRLASSHRLTFESQADGLTASFRAGGTKWSSPAELVPALEMLSDSSSITFQLLCTKLPNKAATAKLEKSLSALAHAGVILVEPGN